MQTFLVFTEAVRGLNAEIGREKVEGDALDGVQAGRDYVVSKEGRLCRVIEKIADLRTEELRVLVRETK